MRNYLLITTLACAFAVALTGCKKEEAPPATSEPAVAGKAVEGPDGTKTIKAVPVGKKPQLAAAAKQLQAVRKMQRTSPSEGDKPTNPKLRRVPRLPAKLPLKPGKLSPRVEPSQHAAPPPDVAAPPADAKRTASGLAWKELVPGKGSDHPAPNSKVTVHYTGWTTDGKMFDSSEVTGQPASFPLERLIPGWREGIPLMTIGQKCRFWIPEKLAYAGRPGKPSGMLVFDVQLLDFEKPE